MCLDQFMLSMHMGVFIASLVNGKFRSFTLDLNCFKLGFKYFTKYKSHKNRYISPNCQRQRPIDGFLLNSVLAFSLL